MRMTITQEREDGQEIEQEYFVESDSAPQYSRSMILRLARSAFGFTTTASPTWTRG